MVKDTLTRRELHETITANALWGATWCIIPDSISAEQIVCFDACHPWAKGDALSARLGEARLRDLRPLARGALQALQVPHVITRPGGSQALWPLRGALRPSLLVDWQLPPGTRMAAPWFEASELGTCGTS